MKLFKKIVIGLAAVLLLAIIAAYLFLDHISKRAIPDYNKTIRLNNMIKPVTIYRDTFAVPHLYAENESDLYRATGFVMAQDRLWQMDLLRRATCGRLSEIFGEDLVKTDLLMRSLRIGEKSKQVLDAMEPNIKNALETFADGVNQYIQQYMDKLPPEFAILGYKPEMWTSLHCINMASYMAWDLSFGWNAEMVLYKISQKISRDKFNSLLPDPALHQPVVFPKFSIRSSKTIAGIDRFKYMKGIDFEPRHSLLAGAAKLPQLGLVVFHGSNNWAVAGKKSGTGKPIMANDMHLGLFAPGIWYQMHQVIKGQLNVTGVVLPGQPCIVAGHNEKIAWGMTNVMVDDTDFYLETLNPKNTNQYKFNGEWKNFLIRKETIKLKGGKSFTDELKFTHRGPVISYFKDISDGVISMCWGGNQPSNEARSVYRLNRAQNWQQFREALRTFTAVSQNIVYADVEGNIGLQTAAGLPLREGGAMIIVPGDTDQYDWKGRVPFEELPYSYNPAEGYVSSANNRTVDRHYPYYISNGFSPPSRIQRMRRILAQKEKLDITDFQAMHADVKSPLVALFMPGILGVMMQTPDLPYAQTRCIELLGNWDGELTPGSPAAVIFEQLYLQLLKNLVEDELGGALYKELLGSKIVARNLMLNTWKNKKSSWIDHVGTKDETETFAQWVRLSFREAVSILQEKMGSEPKSWQYGRIHRLTLTHPLGSVTILDSLFDLNRGPYQLGGSFHTLCPYKYSFKKPYDINHGASQRHIYSTADWDQSLSVIPTGTSGIPASPFYCDQTELYVQNRYHTDFYTEDKISRNAKFITTIQPGGAK